MDLSVDQDSLGDIGSDEFSTSSEIISEETHSLMECSPGDCPDVHIAGSAIKQEEGIWGNIARS